MNAKPPGEIFGDLATGRIWGWLPHGPWRVRYEFRGTALVAAEVTPFDEGTVPPLTVRAWRTIHEVLSRERDLIAGSLALLAADPVAGQYARKIADLAAALREPTDAPKRSGQLDLARWAELYIAVAANHRSPRTEVARLTGYSPEQVRDRIAYARRCELLTSPGTGRSGGELTPAAKQLLKEADRGKHRETT